MDLSELAGLAVESGEPGKICAKQKLYEGIINQDIYQADNSSMIWQGKKLIITYTSVIFDF